MKKDIYIIVGKRLQEARTDKKISLEEAGKVINVHKTTIMRWEDGKTEKLDLTSIETLANYYGVNPAWLAGKDVNKYLDSTDIYTKLDKLGNPVVSIPLLGTVKAGYNYLAQENWIGTIDIDEKMAKSGDFFALKVKGDSMIPAFYEEDIIIVKKQEDFESSDYVVAIINGEEGTVKRIKKTDSSIILQPINTNYEPLVFTFEEMKTIPVLIAGVVYESKRIYK